MTKKSKKKNSNILETSDNMAEQCPLCDRVTYLGTCRDCQVRTVPLRRETTIRESIQCDQELCEIMDGLKFTKVGRATKRQSPNACPWCSKAPEITSRNFVDDEGSQYPTVYAVLCDKLKNEHQVQGPWRETKQGAVRAWNNRKL